MRSPDPIGDTRGAIHRAAAEASLPLSDRQADQLVDYVSLLQRWGATYNLTSIRDPGRIVTHHLADCFVAVEPLRREARSLQSPSVLDVGSGAGLPGIVFGLMNPQWKVTCVDSVGKKAAFVRQVVADLGLAKVDVAHARIESIQERHDVVVARAFSSVSNLVAATEHVLASGGFWMAMKGRRPDDELRDVDPAKWTFHVEQVDVQSLEAERCLIWIRRNQGHQISKHTQISIR